MDMLRVQPSGNASSSSSNDTMDKAKRIWSMLDELAASDPAGYKNYIQKTLKEGKEWMAPPTPHLSARSELLGHPSIKIFYLNIFTWLRLPAPEKKDVLTKMYSLTPVETTHQDKSCIIISIAVHPDVLKCIPTAQLIRSTFDLVVSQHHLLVDYEHYTILREKCIGNVEEIQQNFVKPLAKKTKSMDESFEEFNETGLSSSLIQQISSMTVTDPPNSSPRHPKKPAKPAVLIEELWDIPSFTEEITNNNTFLTVRVSLPGCESVSDCDVTVLPREDLVQVECEKLHTRLKLEMKKRKKPTIPANCQSTFDIQRLTAKFVKKTQHLILSIPILIETKTIEQKK